MRHLCECGEWVDAVGEGTVLNVNCPNCGNYYLFAHKINNPELRLKAEIESKVSKPRPAKRR